MIETNGSMIANALRDHLLTELAEVEGEVKKCEDASAQLNDRLRFLRGLEKECRDRGIELQPPKPEEPPPARHRAKMLHPQASAEPAAPEST